MIRLKSKFGISTASAAIALVLISTTSSSAATLRHRFTFHALDNTNLGEGYVDVDEDFVSADPDHILSFAQIDDYVFSFQGLDLTLNSNQATTEVGEEPLFKFADGALSGLLHVFRQDGINAFNQTVQEKVSFSFSNYFEFSLLLPPGNAPSQQQSTILGSTLGTIHFYAPTPLPTPTKTPEPSSLAALGLLGLGSLAYIKKANASKEV